MKDVLEYKGYHTHIVYNAESQTLRGIIEGIDDFIDFESDSIADIVNQFHSAVDDYLAFCKEIGKSPEKEYKGVFNIRIPPALHRQIAMKANRNGITLNAAVEEAISAYVDEESEYLDRIRIISSCIAPKKQTAQYEAIYPEGIIPYSSGVA